MCVLEGDDAEREAGGEQDHARRAAEEDPGSPPSQSRPQASALSVSLFFGPSLSSRVWQTQIPMSNWETEQALTDTNVHYQ